MENKNKQKINKELLFNENNPQPYELARKIIKRLFPNKKLIKDETFPENRFTNYIKKYQLRGKNGTLFLKKEEAGVIANMSRIFIQKELH